MTFVKRIIQALIGIPLFIILFGMVFYGIGMGLSYKQRTYEREGIQVPGQVVGLTESCDDDGCSYAPVVRYTTQDGESLSFQSSYYSSPPAYSSGESVQVFYLLETPEEAVIQGEGRGFRIAFTIVGGLVIVFGMWIWGTTIKNSYVDETLFSDARK